MRSSILASPNIMYVSLLGALNTSGLVIAKRTFFDLLKVTLSMPLTGFIPNFCIAFLDFFSPLVNAPPYVFSRLRTARHDKSTHIECENRSRDSHFFIGKFNFFLHHLPHMSRHRWQEPLRVLGRHRHYPAFVIEVRLLIHTNI